MGAVYIEGNAMRTFKDLVSFARSDAPQGTIDGVVWRRCSVNPREAVVLYRRHELVGA